MLYALQKRLQKPLVIVLRIVTCSQNQCLDSDTDRGSGCNTQCKARCQEPENDRRLNILLTKCLILLTLSLSHFYKWTRVLII